MACNLVHAQPENQVTSYCTNSPHITAEVDADIQLTSKCEYNYFYMPDSNTIKFCVNPTSCYLTLNDSIYTTKRKFTSQIELINKLNDTMFIIISNIINIGDSHFTLGKIPFIEGIFHISIKNPSYLDSKKHEISYEGIYTLIPYSVYYKPPIRRWNLAPDNWLNKKINKKKQIILKEVNDTLFLQEKSVNLKIEQDNYDFIPQADCYELNHIIGTIDILYQAEYTCGFSATYLSYDYSHVICLCHSDKQSNYNKTTTTISFKVINSLKDTTHIRIENIYNIENNGHYNIGKIPFIKGKFLLTLKDPTSLNVTKNILSYEGVYESLPLEDWESQLFWRWNIAPKNWLSLKVGDSSFKPKRCFLKKQTEEKREK